MRVIAASAILLAGCGGSSAPRGSYSIEQAAQGKDVYAGMCLSCHAGMGNHTGPVFREHWGGHPVADLYQFISTNMPKNDPGTLSPDDNAAVVAYLLQLNGMPAGSKALPADPVALKSIMIDTMSVTSTTR